MSLRIIGGTLKGKKLFFVRGRTTRPTADRLREAVFNILHHRVFGSIVLDLFAGTGAMGIEALSRGAEYALFVESNKRVSSVIERNLRTCRLYDKASIINLDVIKNFRIIKSTNKTFDLIFMDPPYNRGFVKPALNNIYRSNLMKKDGLIIVEHTYLEPIHDDIAGFKLFDQRRYGKTLVSFITK